MYRGDRIFWPDINNQIPDIVCALVKIFLGWNIHMIVVYLSGIWFFIGPTLYEETLGIGVFLTNLMLIFPVWKLVLLQKYEEKCGIFSHPLPSPHVLAVSITMQKGAENGRARKTWQGYRKCQSGWENHFRFRVSRPRPFVKWTLFCNGLSFLELVESTMLDLIWFLFLSDCRKGFFYIYMSPMPWSIMDFLSISFRTNPRSKIKSYTALGFRPPDFPG